MNVYREMREAKCTRKIDGNQATVIVLCGVSFNSTLVNINMNLYFD